MAVFLTGQDLVSQASAVTDTMFARAFPQHARNIHAPANKSGWFVVSSTKHALMSNKVTTRKRKKSNNFRNEPNTTTAWILDNYRYLMIYASTNYPSSPTYLPVSEGDSGLIFRAKVGEPIYFIRGVPLRGFGIRELGGAQRALVKDAQLIPIHTAASCF